MMPTLPKYFRHLPYVAGQRPSWWASKAAEPSYRDGLFGSFVARALVSADARGRLAIRFLEEPFRNADVVFESVEIVRLEGNESLNCAPPISEIVLPLVHPGSNIYGHWLIDILPKIFSFREACPRVSPHVLVNSKTPHWAEELVQLCFANQSFRLTRIHPGVTYEGSTFICPPTRIHDYLSANTLLSGNSISAFEALQPEPRRKVFVARSPGPRQKRELMNRAEVEHLFEIAGFEIVKPESLSLERQVRLFRETRILAGEAGSGLHNSVFMPAGSVVINMQSARQTHFIQSSLCGVAGQQSVYVFGCAESQEWESAFSLDVCDVEAGLEVAMA